MLHPRPTIREIEVLRAYARLGTCDLVAAELWIDRDTVRAHIARLRELSGLHYLPQLTSWAYENDWWVTPESKNGASE